MRMLAIGVAVLLVGTVTYVGIASDFCFECMTFQSHRHKNPERPASTCLKMIACAQADFRANDRDDDGQNQFWRADIAGLYALAPGGGSAIKLIPLDLALADAR